MTTPKQAEPVQVIAIVRITEPNGDGTDKTFHNGTIFTTDAEKAEYYLSNGYARKPTDEELEALARMPRPKAAAVAPAPTATRDMKAADPATPRVGRGYNRRDQQAQK